jgi:multidrug efflux system membrane fusion protein
LDQARYGLKAAEAGRDKARLDLERATNLFNKQSLTKPELDGAKAAFDAAQASVDGVQSQVVQGQARIAGAEAQLEEGEIALRDCALVAPSEGILLKRSVEVGSLVGPGLPVFSIMDVSTVKVVFGAPDVLVNSLRTGQVLPATTEAVPGVAFSGRITRIAPAADPRSRVFEIEITVPNAEGRLKPGMIATIEFQNGSQGKAIPVVPLPAVGKSEKDPKEYSVFVVEHKEGRDYAHARTVRLGAALGNRVAVLDGVRTGESVVVSGTTLVRDGEPVQIIP